ncbi:MAG TPA: DUF1302 family protein [Burkholderiaceae bacterium]|jgi:hypothetical protein|nr:DUF1302 family protein [Burkholderiaceae bacterium]
MKYRITTLAVASALAAMTTSAQGADFEIAGGTLNVGGSVVLGTALRSENPDPALLPPLNAKLIGLTGTAVYGSNVSDGDLNFSRWSQVSSVLKGNFNANYTQQNYGVMLSAKAWSDFALSNQDRPWGNLANDYDAGAPLSDAGFAARAKFSGIDLNYLFAYGEHDIGDGKLEWKVGQQNWSWGREFQTGGGMNDLMVRDYNAMLRPGVLPEEVIVPVPALHAIYTLASGANVEAFVQTSFRPNAIFGCGTFYSQADFVSSGCNQIVVGGTLFSNPQALATGYAVSRAPDVMPSNSVQGGVGIHQDFAAIDSTLGLYLAQYDSRQYFYGVYKATRAAPFAPNNPGNGNSQYTLEYPGGIKMIGITFDKELSAGNILAELTYRPDQPYHYNALDMLNAFNSNTNASALRANATATAPGALFNGYQDMKALQLNLSASRIVPKVLGAESISIAGEVGIKMTPGLPDPSVMRFGRAIDFGNAPLGNAACAAGLTPVECTNAGYDTKSAWGYRVRMSLNYPQLFGGVDFRPSISFAQDVKGWSDDGVFNQGRYLANVDLKAVIKKSFSIDLTWMPTWGGDFNPLSDRSTVALSGAYKF